MSGCGGELCSTAFITVLFIFPYRNIQLLMNTFNIADGNITEENYEKWLWHLNSTDPNQVAELDLNTCDLQALLDQVTSHSL